MKKIIPIILLHLLLSPPTSGAQPVKGRFTHRGNDREYFIYVPDSLAPERPLVFMLHGHGGSAEGYFPAFLETARTHGFAVCFPQGLVEPAPKSKPAWNVGYPFQKGWKVDDCRFILALSGKLTREYSLDRRNVFFSGMSNGGEMCYLMAHRYPEKFAAIASLSGLNMEWIYREMTPGPVPFMEVHGTADTTSKWEGDPVIRHLYTGGTDGKDVVLYEIVGGGHSRGEKDFALGEEMWAFFSRYLKR